MAALDLGTTEADGLAAVAAGLTLSPLQLAYFSDPWSTGSELYGDLAGSLQIRAESDGVAAGSATPLLQGFHAGEADGVAGGFVTQLTLSKLNMQGVANTGASAMARIGGSLQIAGGADGVGATVAPLSGGGNPVGLAGAAWGVSLGNAGRLSCLYSIPAAGGGVGAGSATISLGISTAAGSGGSLAAGKLQLTIGLRSAIAAGSVPAASLRINAEHEAGSDGAGSAAATLGALAQLRGLSGRDGWQRPQLQARGCGIGHAHGTMSIAGPITVSLAGSS